MNLANLPKLAAGAEPFGIPQSANALVEAINKLQIPKKSTLTIRLPTALLAGREFAADASVATTQNSTQIFRVSTEDPGKALDWDGSSSVLTSADSPAYRSLIDGLDRFRKCFPLFLCYPNVIPIDEVVSI